MRALKYRHAVSLANLFATKMAEEISHSGWLLDVVCAVPLHRNRHFQRGYNQSTLIAKPLAKKLGKPYRPLLKRVRPTEPQTFLTQESRFTNVQSAFWAVAAHDLTVLLVDDVITTGATFAACQRALKQAGARFVYSAVVARTVVDDISPKHRTYNSELTREDP
ncbi:MAG: ComF family protein [Trueperaceae bacterium]|nr:MAG: ComF family protein [Trueperaceae bacterium]